MSGLLDVQSCNFPTRLVVSNKLVEAAFPRNWFKGFREDPRKDFTEVDKLPVLLNQTKNTLISVWTIAPQADTY